MTAIKVEGLREMKRASRAAGKACQKEVTAALKDVGGPVADEAERLAQSTIRNATPRWTAMRVASTARAVSILPKARRAGGSPRGNYGGLLMRSMWQANENKQDETVERFEDALDKIGHVFQRG